MPLWRSYESALGWLLQHRSPEGGVAVTDCTPVPYPEVTGYIVPTLLDCGETQVALSMARWLVSVQRPDGGFNAPDGEGASYLFDVSQVLRGFIAAAGLLPELKVPLRKAADWMLASVDANGILRPGPDSAWTRRYGDHISEDIHLYSLSPLLEASRLLGEQRYVDAVERSLAYYLGKPDLARFKFLTHFYGYVLEALVDLGQIDLARSGLQEIIEAQAPDGSIPGVPGARWICSPGSIQLAIVGYKLGLTDFANRALDAMQSLQMPNGGFQGSYGPGAAYGPHSQPSWACKYFLDACHWRMRTTFGGQKERFQRTPTRADPRIDAVVEALGNVSGERVLDVGCGRGQFLRELQRRYPTAELWGVDLAQELLDDLPVGVRGQRASMLNLPFPDASFDAVLSVEALEHAILTERAVAEMCRVLKPGGRLVIVDKNAAYLGLFSIEVWERWFDVDELATILRQSCDEVSSEPVCVKVGDEVRPFLVLWRGIRSSRHVAEPDYAAQSLHWRVSGLGKELLDRYRRAQLQAEARRLAEDGFARFQRGDRRGARRSLLKAIRLDGSWARNRGVLSLLTEASIGSGATSLLRSALAAVRWRDGARRVQ